MNVKSMLLAVVVGVLLSFASSPGNAQAAPQSNQATSYNMCMNSTLCTQALAESIAQSAYSKWQTANLAGTANGVTPDNGAICNPEGCMVEVCSNGGNGSACSWYWCTRVGCKRVVTTPMDAR